MSLVESNSLGRPVEICMNDLLEGLNSAQREAVLHRDSPLLILAGAGSGKTRVITVKIAWMIRELGYDPRSILAVTFTNKAAGEMRERAANLEPAATDVLIRTFHSFGAWLLRRNAAAAGLDPHFNIYDDDDVLTLLGTIYPQQNKATLGQYARMISRAKDYALGPNDDLRAVMDKPDLPEVYAAYEKRLREIGNCDFGDLILLCIHLLRNEPVIKKRLHDRYKVILVDEYQDSNMAQYELLRELVGPEAMICVVGDDDQSIYRFRGAEVKNILTFPESFPGTRVVRLEQNYRSTNPILQVAGAVVEHNQSRLGKSMWTERRDGSKPKLVLFGDQDQEANYIVRLLGDQHWDGSAILYRTNAQSRSYETALLHAGIPYRIVGTLRFYEREEIKDSLSLMRLIANIKDEIAFRRIVNKPSRGIGATSVQQIIEKAGLSGGNLINAAEYALRDLSKKAAQGLRSFLDMFERIQKSLTPAYANLGLFLEHAIAESGLKSYFEDEDQVGGTQKVQNLDELVNAASMFSATADGLTDFLEIVELDSGREIDDAHGERVTLITMHNTKGLEFDRVFVCGLEDGLFPRADEDEDEVEEERRLFYVALTRARNELVLTSCRLRRLHGRIMDLGPSRFLKEIPREMLDVADQGFGRSLTAAGANSYTHVRRQSADEALSAEGAYPRGTRVYHDDYGSGEVVKSWFNGKDEVVIVRFESGASKQFLPKYSSLEKISG